MMRKIFHKSSKLENMCRYIQQSYSCSYPLLAPIKIYTRGMIMHPRDGLGTMIHSDVANVIKMI